MSSLRPIDHYFEKLQEPTAGCMQAMRALLMAFSPYITEEWKYSMPLYYYKGRMFCYLWTQKKTGLPYLGIANGFALQHPDLVQDKRKRMKILNLDPLADLPLEKINDILLAAVHYTNTASLKTIK
jgi:hypothetical protein